MTKAIEQIIKLGGKVNLNFKNNSSLKATNEWDKTYENPVDYLKHECELSKNGLTWLKEVIKKAEDEFSTYDFLVEYYKDEQEDLEWTLKQLNLIETIGEENWIINQI